MEILLEYPSEFVMSTMILFYLVLISIYTNRFHESMSALHKLAVQEKLEIIQASERKEKAALIEKHMQLQKKLSYQYFALGAVFHVVLVVLNAWNFLQFLIPTGLFLFILAGNYWLKGRGVLSVVPNQPDTNGPFH